MPGIDDAQLPSLVALEKLTAPRDGIAVVPGDAASTLTPALDAIPTESPPRRCLNRQVPQFPAERCWRR